ncbi:MAG: hypothetical protein ACFB9N_06225 [Geitlerinemataceae cyanobacterium]
MFPGDSHSGDRVESRPPDPESIDLTAFEISPGEVRRLCGCDPDELWRPSARRRERLLFWGQELMLAIALSPIFTGAIYLFAIRPLLGEVLWLAVLCPIVVTLAIVGGRWAWRQHSTPLGLVALLDDLDRYHDAVRAVAIAESLGEARRRSGDDDDLGQRQALRCALWLTREDLVRALSTERILRENRDFLGVDLEGFSENLTAIQALKTDVRAREYQAIVGQTVAIGASIREEMRKLQE